MAMLPLDLPIWAFLEAHYKGSRDKMPAAVCN
jgi:hypothetical protein